MPVIVLQMDFLQGFDLTQFEVDWGSLVYYFQALNWQLINKFI